MTYKVDKDILMLRRFLGNLFRDALCFFSFFIILFCFDYRLCFSLTSYSNDVFHYSFSFCTLILKIILAVL